MRSSNLLVDRTNSKLDIGGKIVWIYMAEPFRIWKVR